jgi:hypothetical protein
LIVQLYVIHILHRTDAASPAFPRQEDTDFQMESMPYDWFNIDTGEGMLLELENIPDIRSVTYNSDGKVLYATLWLSSIFHYHRSLVPSFGLLIDIDPIPIFTPSSTGWQGADYMLKIG